MRRLSISAVTNKWTIMEKKSVHFAQMISRSELPQANIHDLKIHDENLAMIMYVDKNHNVFKQQDIYSSATATSPAYSISVYYTNNFKRSNFLHFFLVTHSFFYYKMEKVIMILYKHFLHHQHFIKVSETSSFFLFLKVIVFVHSFYKNMPKN